MAGWRKVKRRRENKKVQKREGRMRKRGREREK